MYTHSEYPDCSMYNSSLFNDLRKYSFSINNNGSITYEADASTYDVDFKIDRLDNIIGSDISTAEEQDVDTLDNAWYPAFITTSQSDQNKKTVLEKIDFKEDSLGINDFISFVGKFNYWKTLDADGGSEVNRFMSSDWRLTNKYNNFSPLYGVLCWYRRNSTANLNMKFRFMPVGTVFLAETEYYQKTDDRTAKKLSVDRSALNSSLNVDNPPEFIFTDEEELYNYSLNGDTSYQVVRIVGGSTFSNRVDAIYIPNGESFAFHDNVVDAARAAASSLYSYSYVSPALHGVYREIFNALYPYARGYTMSENKTRAFNLLCNFMSTGPQIDRVTISSLSDSRIKTAVLDFLNNLGGGDPVQENLQVFKCIYKIINITSDSAYDKVDRISLNDYVCSKEQLFYKIISKYTPELTLGPGEDTILRYVDPEEPQNRRSTFKDGSNGIHLSFSNVATTYYDETASNEIQQNLDETTAAFDNISDVIESRLAADEGVPADMISSRNALSDAKDQLALDLEASMSLFNNYGVFLGNDAYQYMSYQTDFNKTQSQADVKAFQKAPPSDPGFTSDKLGTGIVYYADYELPAMSDNTLYLGRGHVGSIATSFGFGEIPSDERLEIEDALPDSSPVDTNYADAQYSWRVRKGPGGLRFGYEDFVTPPNINAGGIRGTPTRTGKTYNTAIIPFVFLGVTQSGTWEIELTRSVGPFAQVDRTIITTESSSYLNPTLSSDITSKPIYFRKINCGFANTIAFDKAGLIWLVDTSNFINVNDNDVVEGGHSECLKAEDIRLFITDNTGGKVFDGIQTIATSNTYLDLTYKPENTTISIYALNISYLRDECHPYCSSSYSDRIYAKRDVAPSGIAFYRGANRVNGSLKTWKSFSSNVFTEFAWPTDEVYTGAPVRTYGGFNERQLSQILGSSRIGNHKELIPLDKRNDMLLPTGIFCYKENIAITGNEIALQKGLFDPEVGFVYPDDPHFVDNRSYALEDRTEKYSTHLFEGRGFYDLRPHVENGLSKPHRSSIYINPNKFVDDSQPFQAGDNRRKGDSYGYKSAGGPRHGDHSMYRIGASTPNGHDEDYVTGELQESYDLYEQGSLDADIKHIEVNLNYLNYQNPQNLSFVLEMYDQYGTKYENHIDTMSSDPPSEINNYETIYNDELKDYYDALRILHTTGQVCLINQEHIKNYNPNYVLRFSDFYDKNIVASTRETFNSLGTQRTHLNLSDHQNEEKLSPTAFADLPGAETECLSDVHMVNAIKNNSIGGFFTHLNKFSGEKMGGITAKLAVYVVNPFDYRTTIMDNLLSNDTLSNLKNLNKRTTSNTINNSLCNWELILHRNDVPGYHRKDTLGKIAYDKNSFVENSIGPFNYMFDAKPNKTVIPNVNVNAPYSYIEGVSNCSYYDALNDLLGDTLPGAIGFPNLIGYLLFVASFFGGIGLGAMGALITLANSLSNGGVNDPIVNYFIQNRIAARISNLNRAYFTPVYRNSGFGKPDRVVVCLSNNKSYWYTTEVPIFKYQNTTKSYRQKLAYVLIYKNSPFGGLGRFSYSILENYRELDLINCKYVLSTDVSTTFGEKLNYNYSYQSTIDGSTHEKKINLFVGDIVQLNNQTIPENNGYWLVQDDNWIRFPDNNYVFLQNHKLNVSSSTNWYAGHHIIIDGYRAYYHFDVGKTVLLAGNIANTITSSNLISTNSGYKTILGFRNAVQGDGYVGYSASASNRILVFNPRFQTSEQDLSNKNNSWVEDSNFVYKWPMEEHKQGLNTDSHDVTNTATPEGGIGYGTDIIRHGTLDTEQKTNKSFDIHDQANNKNNDQYKYFNFSITHKSPVLDEDGNIAVNEDEEGNPIEGDYILEEKTSRLTFSSDDSTGDKMRAYRYSIKDLGIYSGHGLSQELDLLDSAQGVDTISSKTLDDAYKPIYFAIQELYEEDFIEIATNKIRDINNEIFEETEYPGSFNLSDTGVLMIDKDLNYNNKIVSFYPQEYASMTGHYEDITGRQENTITTFDQAKVSSNLIGLRNYFNTLINDPIECQTSGYYTPEDCHKTYLKHRIRSKENEANDIYHALNIAYTGEQIAPHTRGSFSLNGTNDSSISYNDTNYYWIHVDPENGCFVSNEMSVKIPTHTEYQLLDIGSTINGNQLTTRSHITPDSRSNIYPVPQGEDGVIQVTDLNGGSYRIDYTDKKQQDIKNAWQEVDPSLDFSNMVEYSFGSTNTSNVDVNKMLLNFGDNTNGALIAWQDYYERPAALGSTYADYQLKEVIDFGEPVYMKFRVMPPRKLKYHDQRAKVYIPTKDGGLSRSVKPISTQFGTIANDFYCWRCVDQENQYTTTTPFFKMMNEMIFRGFFGSTDGVEQTNKISLTSQDVWEWIPYDYKVATNSLNIGTLLGAVLDFSAGRAEGHCCNRAVYNLAINGSIAYYGMNLNNAVGQAGVPSPSVVYRCDRATFSYTVTADDIAGISTDNEGTCGVFMTLQLVCQCAGEYTPEPETDGEDGPQYVAPRELQEVPLQHPSCDPYSFSCHNDAIKLTATSAAGTVFYDGIIGETQLTIGVGG